MGYEVLSSAFAEMWEVVAMGLPRLVVAIIVFAVGWIIAGLLYKVVVKIIKSLRIDSALRPTGLARAFERAGHPLNTGRILGFLVKWFVIIAFLVTVLDYLGMDQANSFLRDLVNYIPSVIGAIVVLLGGFVLGSFVKQLIKGSTKMFNVNSASFLGNVARVAIIVFAFIIALNLLAIGREVINVLFMGIVAMLSLAGGLAFGLGGRDAAAKAIEGMKKEFHK
jgi:hypothetical protein